MGVFENIETVNSVTKTIMILLISALLLINFFYHKEKILKTRKNKSRKKK